MKNYLLTLLLLTLILTSCLFSGCPVVKISKEDKDWLLPFQKYKKLKFENQNGDSHIFRIQKIDSSYTPCNKFELGPNQYQEIHIGYSSNTVLNSPLGKYQSISFSIASSDKKNSKSKKLLYVYDFSVEFYDMDSNFTIDTIFCPALNKKLMAYYFNIGDKYSTHQTDLNVKSIHYNKDYGVLQYISKQDTFKLTEIK